MSSEEKFGVKESWLQLNSSPAPNLKLRITRYSGTIVRTLRINAATDSARVVIFKLLFFKRNGIQKERMRE